MFKKGLAIILSGGFLLLSSGVLADSVPNLFTVVTDIEAPADCEPYII